MFPNFNFPGYHPRNYQPGQQDDDTPLATVAQLAAARAMENAEFIDKDGSRVYKWLYNIFYYADWDGLQYGTWFEWRGEKLPAGELVEL